MSTPTFPTLTLNDGHKMPILGLGCLELINDPSLVRDAVYEAIRVGYRHFDTAWIYKTERLVGEGITRAISEGLVRREEVFVTTKVWMFHLKREDVIAQAKESNENLGLGYIDLLLVHGPVPLRKQTDANAFMPMKQDGTPDVYDDLDIHTETWSAMEQVHDMGIAKSIGVSNYGIQHLIKTLAHARIKPAVNQIESNPLFQQMDIIDFCQKKGIAVTAYCPFGGPARKPRDGQSEDFNRSAEENKKSLWDNETIRRIAEKHGKTVSQILLKFHTSRGVAVIPKTVREERLVENSNIFDFDLDAEDLQNLASLEAGKSCEPESFRAIITSF